MSFISFTSNSDRQLNQVSATSKIFYFSTLLRIFFFIAERIHHDITEIFYLMLCESYRLPTPISHEPVLFMHLAR